MFSLQSKISFIVVLGLVVTLLTASPSHGGGVITENFNNNQYAQQYWWINSIGAGVDSTVANNRLEITLPVSTGGSLYMGMMGSNFALAGDFDMQVDFSLLNWPANNASQIGLSIDQANDCSIFRRSRGVNEGGGGEIYFTMIKGQMSQVPASGSSGTLRMTRTGNTMAGYYWDGANWLLVGTGTDASLGAPTHVNSNLNRDSSFSGPSVQAAFGNIQLTYDTLMWTIYESFNNNSYDQDLFWLNTSGVGTAVVQNQQLQVTIPANNGVDFAVAGLEDQFQLVGDFDIQVDFNLSLWPVPNGVSAGIITPLFMAGRSSFHDNLNGNMNVYVAGFPTLQKMFFVNTADTSGKFRLARIGNTVTAFYWQSGTGTWQKIGSQTDPRLGGPTEGYIGAESGGGGYGPTQTVTANFDNYQILYTKLKFGNASSPVGALMLLLQ